MKPVTPELERTRHGLRLKTSQLQVRAMDLVQSIDRVNQHVQDFENARAEVRETVKHRAFQMQEAVRGIERRLLAQVDSKEFEEALREEAFDVKNNLHTALRSTLTMVDFLRLLSGFGHHEDIETYVGQIRQREQDIYSKPITLTNKMYKLDMNSSDLESELVDMFGVLSEISEEKCVWDLTASSHHHEIQRQSSEIIDPTHLLYGEGLSSHIRSPVEHLTHHGRSHFTGHSSQKSRRNTLQKSMSFDTHGSSPYQYVTSDNQQLYDAALLQGTSANKAAEYKVLNEKEGVTHEKLNKAVDMLVSSSAKDQPFSPSHRRTSAPSTTILDALNRRRLSALTILERSNISTEGLTMASDIEAGMSEARQEWQHRHQDKGDRHVDFVDGV